MAAVKFNGRNFLLTIAQTHEVPKVGVSPFHKGNGRASKVNFFSSVESRF